MIAPVPLAASFRLEDVHVDYAGTAALCGVSLDVAAGETLAFVGPSGSGKTTLLRLLAGTLRPTAGRILVDEVDVATLSRRSLGEMRSRIGFVHQDLCLVPNLRVVQNVVAGQLGRRSFLSSLRLMTRPARGDLRHAHEILERVGIEEKLFERSDRLSGGQRQRVAVARALFQDPRALLADEPVSSVDPARAKDTVKLLAELAAEANLTLLMSLHHPDLARTWFPRIVGLRQGRVAFDAPTASLDDATWDALYTLDDTKVSVCEAD